jgi:hypothetical protein
MDKATVIVAPNELPAPTAVCAGRSAFAADSFGGIPQLSKLG